MVYIVGMPLLYYATYIDGTLFSLRNCECVRSNTSWVIKSYAKEGSNINALSTDQSRDKLEADRLQVITFKTNFHQYHTSYLAMITAMQV